MLHLLPRYRTQYMNAENALIQQRLEERIEQSAGNDVAQTIYRELQATFENPPFYYERLFDFYNYPTVVALKENAETAKAANDVLRGLEAFFGEILDQNRLYCDQEIIQGYDIGIPGLSEAETPNEIQQALNTPLRQDQIDKLHYAMAILAELEADPRLQQAAFITASRLPATQPFHLPDSARQDIGLNQGLAKWGVNLGGPVRRGDMLQYTQVKPETVSWYGLERLLKNTVGHGLLRNEPEQATKVENKLLQKILIPSLVLATQEITPDVAHMRAFQVKNMRGFLARVATALDGPDIKFALATAVRNAYQMVEQTPGMDTHPFERVTHMAQDYLYGFHGDGGLMGRMTQLRSPVQRDKVVDLLTQAESGINRAVDDVAEFYGEEGVRGIKVALRQIHTAVLVAFTEQVEAEATQIAMNQLFDQFAQQAARGDLPNVADDQRGRKPHR